MTVGQVLGICVGGRGSRMGGVQKALLIAPDTGETLVARSIRLGREAGHEVVLLGAAELGAAAAGVLQLPDAAAGIGPLAGLRSLLAYAGPRDALCLACDMPYISAALLARLTNETLLLTASASQPAHNQAPAATGRASSAAAHVLAPRDVSTGKWQPLFARYHSSAVAALLERALAEGERSFQGLFKRLTIRELLLDEGERAQLQDWDTPEDLPAPP